MSTEQAVQAQAVHEDQLLNKANVVGVGVGYKDAQGENTGEVAVVVLVEQKKPLAALSATDVIPPELEGMRTDVVEVGYLRAQQGPRDRYRPVIPSGVSVAHYQVTAGTLGTIVMDRATGTPFLLSNNHVFANSNQATPGDSIFQPAPMDGGGPADKVATLDRYMQLVFLDDPADAQPRLIRPNQPPVTTPTNGSSGGTSSGGTSSGGGGSSGSTADPQGCVQLVAGLVNVLAMLLGSQKRVTVAEAAAAAAGNSATAAGATATFQASAVTPSNLVDCALAKPVDPTMFSDNIQQIGVVNDVAPAVLGQRVRKFGRTTGLTEGNITLLNATVNIAYNTTRGPRTARFTGQVITEGMSSGGDSGSLVVDAASLKAVGLLFAGSELATIFTPIQVVLDQLQIRL